MALCFGKSDSTSEEPLLLTGRAPDPAAEMPPTIAPAAASVIEAVTATAAEFHNMLATVAFNNVERAKLGGYLTALHRHLDCMRLCSDNFEAVRFHQKQAEELCGAALHDARRAGPRIKGTGSGAAADNVIVPFAPRP